MTAGCVRIAPSSVRTIVLLVCLALLPVAQAAAAADRTYPTDGECGGLPRIRVGTPPGWCVGVVAQGLRFPRGLARLPNGDLVVAEMGGWIAVRGSVSLLRKAAGYGREPLFEKLILPHAMLPGPDGRTYVGVVGGVFRRAQACQLTGRSTRSRAAGPQRRARRSAQPMGVRSTCVPQLMVRCWSTRTATARCCAWRANKAHGRRRLVAALIASR